METPDRMTATPQQIMEFLREHLAEDRILLFLQDVGNAAVHEAAADLHQRSADKSQQAEWDFNHEGIATAEEWSDAADEIDPEKGGGPYPSKLLCYRHGGGKRVRMRPCPGSPRCGPMKWDQAGKA